MDSYSVDLVSDPNLLKHCRVTHMLNFWPIMSVLFAQTLESDSHPRFLADLVSDFYLLKVQRATHNLDGCSVDLVSSSDLLKCCRGTHILQHIFDQSCQWFLSVQ